MEVMYGMCTAGFLTDCVGKWIFVSREHCHLQITGEGEWGKVSTSPGSVQTTQEVWTVEVYWQDYIIMIWHRYECMCALYCGVKVIANFCCVPMNGCKFSRISSNDLLLAKMKMNQTRAALVETSHIWLMGHFLL